MRKRKNDNSLIFCQEGQYHLEKTPTFSVWISGVGDTEVRSAISKRLTRVAGGNLGDVKPLGDSVFELRVFFRSGYRVYFMFRGGNVIRLLTGGGKGGQKRDIVKAKKLARELIDVRGNHTL